MWNVLTTTYSVQPRGYSVSIWKEIYNCMSFHIFLIRKNCPEGLKYLENYTTRTIKKSMKNIISNMYNKLQRQSNCIVYWHPHLQYYEGHFGTASCCRMFWPGCGVQLIHFWCRHFFKCSISLYSLIKKKKRKKFKLFLNYKS